MIYQNILNGGFMENNENFGDIKISEDVVSVIAFLASKNVVGVSSMQNSFGTGIAEFLGKKVQKKV